MSIALKFLESLNSSIMVHATHISNIKDIVQSGKLKASHNYRNLTPELDSLMKKSGFVSFSRGYASNIMAPDYFCLLVTSKELLEKNGIKLFPITEGRARPTHVGSRSNVSETVAVGDVPLSALGFVVFPAKNNWQGTWKDGGSLFDSEIFGSLGNSPDEVDSTLAKLESKIPFAYPPEYQLFATDHINTTDLPKGLKDYAVSGDYLRAHVYIMTSPIVKSAIRKYLD